MSIRTRRKAGHQGTQHIWTDIQMFDADSMACTQAHLQVRLHWQYITGSGTMICATDG